MPQTTQEIDKNTKKQAQGAGVSGQLQDNQKRNAIDDILSSLGVSPKKKKQTNTKNKKPVKQPAIVDKSLADTSLEHKKELAQQKERSTQSALASFSQFIKKKPKSAYKNNTRKGNKSAPVDLGPEDPGLIRGMSRQDFESWRLHRANKAQSDDIPPGSFYPQRVWDQFYDPQFVTIEMHNPINDANIDYRHCATQGYMFEGLIRNDKPKVGSVLFNIAKNDLSSSMYWAQFVSRLILVPQTLSKEMKENWKTKKLQAFYRPSVENMDYWAPGFGKRVALGFITAYAQKQGPEQIAEMYWAAASLTDSLHLTKLSRTKGSLLEFYGWPEKGPSVGRFLGLWSGDSFKQAYYETQKGSLQVILPDHLKHLDSEQYSQEILEEKERFDSDPFGVNEPKKRMR